MSYQLKISDRSRVAARFIRKVHRELQNAFSHAANRDGLTQQALAQKLDIDRSTVNKRLLGQDNLTLRSIADLAWALDSDIAFYITPRDREGHRNDQAVLQSSSTITRVDASQVKPTTTRTTPTYSIPLSSRTEAEKEYA